MVTLHAPAKIKCHLHLRAKSFEVEGESLSPAKTSTTWKFKYGSLLNEYWYILHRYSANAERINHHIVPSPHRHHHFPTACPVADTSDELSAMNRILSTHLHSARNM
jgi:hypothetical protein